MLDTPDKLRLAVQISVAIASALGTLLLGLGQQSVFLPSIAILSAVASIVLTDSLGIFRLNRNLANIAALLAVTYSIVDVTYGGRDNQSALIAVANLLVYLQIVLQFQEKSLRIYWSLAVLSLLQVVVASALNLSVSFGPLLVVYLLVALTSLSLLFIYRETERFHDGEAEDEERAAPGPPRRWPLAGVSTFWSGAAGDDLARPLLGKRLAWHVVSTCLLTAVVTALIFFGVPRSSDNSWRSAGASAVSVTGFSEEVSLGRMGRILQSDAEVLRVTFKDAENERPFVVNGECYLRGTALSRYRSGRWLSDVDDLESAFAYRELAPANPLRGRVIQDVKLDRFLQPGVGDRYKVLFSTYPVYRHQRQQFTLADNYVRNQLVLDDDSLSGKIIPQLNYTVRSGAFRGTRLAQFTPEQYDFRKQYLTQLTVAEEPLFPQLQAAAQQIINDAGATTPLQQALAIEAHFQVPGRYNYDLDPDVELDPALDPIEDFVANHRTGHCEYFASAMILMCRSVGLPARMVVGYKSGEWNSVGSYYQVRELHAHAWVEVYLAPGEFPKDELPDGADTTGGAWMRLDPTPADLDDDAEVDANAIIAQIGDMVDYVQILWDDYVLGLNSERQYEAIYHPILTSITSFLQSLRGERSWAGGVLMSISAAMISVLLLALGLGFYQRRMQRGRKKNPMSEILGAPSRWIARFFESSASHASPARPVHVAFYQRLEELLDRRGLSRQAGQTQREFAIAAGGVLADAPQLQSVAGVPRRVANAFYQVRFGSAPLDNAQQQAVEQSLADLELALNAADRTDKQKQ